MTKFPDDARRVRMDDGREWRVVRRHEMARILTRRDSTERRLYLLFVADDGTVRRVEVAPEFPDPTTVGADELIVLWRAAQQLG